MTLLFVLSLFAAQADTLTLENAYRAADAHYPRAREAEIARTVRDLRLKNLDARFLPAFSLGGQAVYYSHVPEIPIDAPAFDLPSVANDQYRVGLTVDQLLYDGGATSAQREVERTTSEIRGQEVAVATYGLREQIEAAWFTVLLGRAESATIDALVEDLTARLGQARALVARGAATGSNADVLAAELIRVRQQRQTARSRVRSGLDVLELLTGWRLPEDAPLQMPGNPALAEARIDRPENTLFDLTRQNLSNQAAIVSRRTRPRVTTFVEGAVGRPQGLDFFQNEFGPFVSLGVRVGWQFWDWSASGRDAQALALQQDAVQAREDAFLQGVRAQAAAVRREIERLESHLEGDAEIIALRARISAEASSRLDNGVITATDYLVERNEEHRARLSEVLHRIQLAQAVARLQTIVGEQ